MKQTYHKVSHALMTLLLLVSTFIPLLSLSPRVFAAELGDGDYQLTTNVTINTNPLTISWPIPPCSRSWASKGWAAWKDRKSTRLN